MFFKNTQLRSPNTQIEPVTFMVNHLDHLVIGGCDTVELAEKYGTPLWILDEQTILEAIASIKAGLADYPNSQVLYAGKAFLCLAMCHIARHLNLGLDVVSEGELFTARQAGFPSELIYMHGNNKSRAEITSGLSYGPVKIVVDSFSELELVNEVAGSLNQRAKVLLRLTPGVEPDTHQHILTGHHESKFGLPLEELYKAASWCQSHQDNLELIGLHAHIGSQINQLEPYLKTGKIMADCFLALKDNLNLNLQQLDMGGGLGIAYTVQDNPIPLHLWSSSIAETIKREFQKRNLTLPTLILEPGRSIIGPAGITLYRAGHQKKSAAGTEYIAVDGGMSDNPRPILYQSVYTICIANRMGSPATKTLRDAPLITIAGKYCESGDILVKDTPLAVKTGDVLAMFSTGAYAYSMSSNYNRTPRPACVLVAGGKTDLILERESFDNLLSQDRVPNRLITH